MTVVISGTNGIQNVLGSAAAPAESNTTSSNTGLYFPTSTTLGLSTAGTNAVYIDASQNVGIGTSSPSYKLEVVGGIRVTLSGQAQIWNGATGIYTSYQYNGTTNGDIGTGNQAFSGGATGDFGITSRAGNLVLGTGTTERARIDSSGNLLVGTTSASAKLQVNGNGATNPLFIASGNTAGDVGVASITLYKYDNNNTTSQIFQKFVINNGANGSGSITANGASNAAFTAFSDQRLKENIVDLPSQLANIMALRPVEFDYIESVGGGHQIGFIAQEVQTVYPDLVGVGENEMLTLTDMNKNDARLIKAIQEQQALITSLTARIEALEST